MRNYASIENRQTLKKVFEGINRYGLFQNILGLIKLFQIKATNMDSCNILTKKDHLNFHIKLPSQLMPTLILYSELSVSEITLLRNILSPGDIMLDVGSGIGCYAVFGAKVCLSQVHAFEPMPVNVQTLQTNINLNDVASSVFLNPVAVSSINSKARMGVQGNVSFNNRILGDGYNDGISVDTVALDSYCKEHSINHIRVLNVDVEGHDLDVLNGSSNIFKHNMIDFALFEIHYSFSEVYQIVVNYGYTAFYFNHNTGYLSKLNDLSRATLVKSRPSAFNRRIVFVNNAILDEVRSSNLIIDV